MGKARFNIELSDGITRPHKVRVRLSAGTDELADKIREGVQIYAAVSETKITHAKDHSCGSSWSATFFVVSKYESRLDHLNPEILQSAEGLQSFIQQTQRAFAEARDAP